MTPEQEKYMKEKANYNKRIYGLINSGAIHFQQGVDLMNSYKGESEPLLGHCPIGTPLEPSKPTCNHRFVDVGFQYSKFVCAHCNKEQV